MKRFCSKVISILMIAIAPLAAADLMSVLNGEAPPRVAFVTGRVMLSGGVSPSEPVLIERVCNEVVRSEGYTDSKGHFAMALSDAWRRGVDVSEPFLAGGGLRQLEGMNCELRAVLPGFHSEAVAVGTRHYLDDPDIGIILLRRVDHVEGLTISSTSLAAPKAARKGYEKGLEYVRKNKLQDARKEFLKAVDGYPKYAAAWYELGRVQESGNVEAARQSYARAIAADSGYIKPYERLYLLAARESKWQDVADMTDRVSRLNPYDFPGAYYFNAMANLQMNHIDIAEKSARQAIKLDDHHRQPKAGYVLGLALARKRNYTEAAEYLRAYLATAPKSPDSEAVRGQLAAMERFAAKH